MPLWNVHLLVEGPVDYRGPNRTTQQKGFRPDDPFYSDIAIRPVPSGLSLQVTARADTTDLARKAAVYFVGKMLDALAIEIDQPLVLSTADERAGPPRSRNDVRRIVELAEIEAAFAEAHLLSRDRPSFLRSLGWYRKGLQTDDQFDAFLAFWNAIEVVASKDYPKAPGVDMERAKKGAKNQVWACFMGLWGEPEGWPLEAWVEGGGVRGAWVDRHYDTRVDVAHGVASVDIHKVAEIANLVPGLQSVARSFLRGWRAQFLNAKIQPELEGSPHLEDYY